MAAVRPRLRLMLEVALWRYGVGAAAGLALVLSAGLFWALQIRPVQLVAQAEAAADAPTLLPTRFEDVSIAPQGHARLQDRLFAIMPAKADAHRTIAEIVAQAHTLGIVIESVDLQFRDDLPAGWSLASFNVPLQGSYPAIRRLLEELLREHPYLALDQVSFRRDSALARQAQVQVRLTGWYRITNADTNPSSPSVSAKEGR